MRAWSSPIPCDSWRQASVVTNVAAGAGVELGYSTTWSGVRGGVIGTGVAGGEVVQAIALSFITLPVITVMGSNVAPKGLHLSEIPSRDVAMGWEARPPGFLKPALTDPPDPFYTYFRCLLYFSGPVQGVQRRRQWGWLRQHRQLALRHHCSCAHLRRNRDRRRRWRRHLAR